MMNYYINPNHVVIFRGGNHYPMNPIKRRKKRSSQRSIANKGFPELNHLTKNHISSSNKA
jgi:hypothetical protein